METKQNNMSYIRTRCRGKRDCLGYKCVHLIPALCSLATIHNRMPDCHQVSWAWMTSQLSVALVRKLLES